MQKIVEFKIDQGGIRWEDIPVTFVVDVSDKSFDGVADYCYDLARRITSATRRTVRWERQGVGQGHYVTPVLSDLVSLEEVSNG